MATIFSKIINGDIPSYKIAENDHCYAFLDINPLNEGHTLVVPKKEVDYILDLDDTTYGELLDFSRKIAKGIDKAVDCLRVGIAVVGLEVPHCHIHLVPLKGVHDLDFSRPKKNFSEEEFHQIAERIRQALKAD